MDEISPEEAERLADAAWASDILGPDDFAELQTTGEKILATEGYFKDKLLVPVLFNEKMAAEFVTAVMAMAHYTPDYATAEQIFKVDSVCFAMAQELYRMLTELGVQPQNFWLS